MQDGPGLLPFNLGPTKVISHYHSFLQYVPINDIRNNIIIVKTQLTNIGRQINNQSLPLYEPHINYLKSKLGKVYEQLDTFQSSRVKRALIDGLGSVIKSISGNLDYTDALRYDGAIKILQDNENKLTSELNEHISLGKQWMLENSKILDNIVSNQNKIGKAISLIENNNVNMENEIIKYTHVAQHLLLLGDNIEKLSDELLKLENILAFIHASSMHHSVLDVNSLKYMIDRLRLIYSKGEV